MTDIKALSEEYARLKRELDAVSKKNEDRMAVIRNELIEAAKNGEKIKGIVTVSKVRTYDESGTVKAWSDSGLPIPKKVVPEHEEPDFATIKTGAASKGLIKFKETYRLTVDKDA